VILLVARELVLCHVVGYYDREDMALVSYLSSLCLYLVLMIVL